MKDTKNFSSVNNFLKISSKTLTVKKGNKYTKKILNTICDPIIGSSVAQDLYVLLTLTEVDAVRPEMVDEVLQDVHHVGGDVVEGDGVVAAAGESLLVRVVLVGRVPVGEVTRDQVMLRDKREESLLAPGVPRVSGLHSELLHAQTHLHVLVPPVVLPTHVRIVSTRFINSSVS